MQKALFSKGTVKLLINENFPTDMAQKSAIEEIPVLDNENISECLKVILHAQDENQRKIADNYLINCEKNPMFYSFLLEIFETSKVYILLKFLKYQNLRFYLFHILRIPLLSFNLFYALKMLF